MSRPRLYTNLFARQQRVGGLLAGKIFTECGSGSTSDQEPPEPEDLNRTRKLITAALQGCLGWSAPLSRGQRTVRGAHDEVPR